MRLKIQSSLSLKLKSIALAVMIFWHKSSNFFASANSLRFTLIASLVIYISGFDIRESFTVHFEIIQEHLALPKFHSPLGRPKKAVLPLRLLFTSNIVSASKVAIYY